MRAWVAVLGCLGATALLAVLLWLVLPRQHVEAVLPQSALDYLPAMDIPFEAPGAMEIGGVYIDNILPRWKKDSELLFFSHIPRTSGGTMSYVLNATFAPFVHPASTEGRPVARLNQFRNTPPHMWTFYKTLYTHEDFSFPYIIPYPVANSVFIRDPADGVFRRWCSGKYSNISLWIDSPDYPRTYQIEWLVGATNYWPWSKATSRYVKYMIENPDHMLRLAKENLAKTVFMGLTERHSESMCLFFYSMRLPPKVEGKDWKSVHEIKSERKSAVMKEKQRPLLLLEYELYDFAVELFEARLDWARRDFAVNKEYTADFVSPECKGVLD